MAQQTTAAAEDAQKSINGDEGPLALCEKLRETPGFYDAGLVPVEDGKLFAGAKFLCDSAETAKAVGQYDGLMHDEAAPKRVYVKLHVDDDVTREDIRAM